MKILQICDYAAKYRGNFIESLEYFRKNSLGDGDTMLYAFPERTIREISDISHLVSPTGNKWIYSIATAKGTLFSF